MHSIDYALKDFFSSSSSECVRSKLKVWLWSPAQSSYWKGAMTSFSSLAVSIRNLIFQFSEIQEVIMCKNPGKGSFYPHLLLHPKQTQGCLWTSRVSTRVGVLRNPEVSTGSFCQGWLRLSEKVERFTDFKPSHGLLVYSCSLTYHRPKQSFCLSNSWLAMVQELCVTQEGSSEMIMTNPVIGVCLSVQNFFQPLSCLFFPSRLHSVLFQIKETVLDT